MTDLTFAIIQAAVTLAKNERIKTVVALKERLLNLYPKKETEINKAISFWSKYVQSKEISAIANA